MPDEEVQNVQIDRTQQGVIEVLRLLRGQGELRLDGDGVAEIVRTRIPENDVPARGPGRREASCGAGGADSAGIDVEALRIGSFQEGRQPDRRRIFIWGMTWLMVEKLRG